GSLKPAAKRSLRGFDGNTTEEAAEKVEYLTGVDERGKLTLKDPKPAKQPLVIPLPQVEDWRQKRRKTLADAHAEPTTAVASSDFNATPAAAGDALHKETDCQAYGLMVPSKTAHTMPSSDRPALAPIDQQRRDVAQHPDDATLEDYDEVPSEDFANALLRGMSWKDGEGIGRTRQSQGPIPSIELRPSLLGLGARPPSPKESNGSRPPGPPLASQSRQVRQALSTSAFQAQSQANSTAASTPQQPAAIQRLIAELPTKPDPPSDDMCCMSGCARCVWDIYNEELFEFETQVNKIREACQAANVPLPPAVLALEQSAVADQANNPLAAASGLLSPGAPYSEPSPPSPAEASMRAFMELEKKLGK
ncbi:DNA primase large subunit Spp2, partial [Dimargaris verticillata]